MEMTALTPDTRGSLRVRQGNDRCQAGGRNPEIERGRGPRLDDPFGTPSHRVLGLRAFGRWCQYRRHNGVTATACVGSQKSTHAQSSIR
jgi:hypothetical protein